MYLPDAKLIAVIDDDFSVACGIASLVRSLGFDVRTFRSAEDFLSVQPLGEAACIICDVQMPGMTGIELYEMLVEQGSQVPIIFITAFSQDRVRQRAGEDACILHKPFEASELTNCLKQAILPS